MSEQVFDVVKRMLNLGPNTGLGFFDLFIQLSALSIRQCFTFAWTHSDMPLYRAVFVLFAFLYALVAGVTEGDTLFAV